MPTKTKAWVVGVLAGAASYLHLWLIPFMSNPILWLALCGLAGFLAFLISDTTMATTEMAVLTGAFSLNAIQIAIDVVADRASHNLFPLPVGLNASFDCRRRRHRSWLGAARQILDRSPPHRKLTLCLSAAENWHESMKSGRPRITVHFADRSTFF